MSALDTAMERFGNRGTRHVRPVPRAAAEGLVAAVYQQLARELQLAPPLTVHAPAPRLLAWGAASAAHRLATWLVA